MKLKIIKKYLLIGMLLFTSLILTSCDSALANPSVSGKISPTSTPLPINTDKPSDKEIITNIANWNHPVKDIFNQYKITIMKVELLNNGVFPIFYVQFDAAYKLDSRHAGYFNVLINKIATANAYWDFKVIDEKNNLVFYVECDKEKRSVADITANDNKGLLNEMLDYNNKMTSNYDKVTEYLMKSVPEIYQFSEKILKDSNGKVSLIIRLDGVPDKYSDNQNKDYYSIYVGENHQEYSVRWNSFNVKYDLTNILVDNVMTGELLSLEQWRAKSVG